MILPLPALSSLREACLALAAVPAVLYCINLFFYRKPALLSAGEPEAVSVLIPARNEEASIRACVASVLQSTGVPFEVVVLDDASTDRTAEYVTAMVANHPNLRLEQSAGLLPGWNGKQHACAELARFARFDVFCFIDADVRLCPDALARMSAFLQASGSDLVSGFPRQQTETLLEWLLLPLIQFILMGYLPMAGLRWTRLAGFAAGCGQFMMARRAAYQAAGGHTAIRTTMHDGIMLPRLLRAHGFHTDLADLSSLAVCRMYHSASEVWNGLTKNATEGIASPAAIVPFTILLLGGAVLPALLFFIADANTWPLAALTLALCYLPRVLGVLRFGESIRSALLHPLAILVLLALEWNALLRKVAGIQSAWKERTYNVG